MSCSEDRGRVAELDVVDVLGDGRMVAADRALRVTPDGDLVEGRSEGVEEEEPPGERVAASEDELERLVRLDRPDDPREDAEDPALRAARSELGRRRLREEAAVARAGAGAKTVVWPSNRKIDPCTTGIRCQIDASFRR